MKATSPSYITIFTANCTTLAKQLSSVGLSVFLLIILGLSACEEPKDIGFNLIPQNEVGVFFSDTFSVETSTVLLDTFSTKNTLNLLIGRYDDPALGIVQANTYFETIPANDSLVLIEHPDREPIYDSLVLSLNLVYRYANTSSNQTFTVHRLTQRIDSEVNYTNRSSLSFDTNPLATFTGSGEDIVENGGNRVDLKLDDTFGQALFDLANTGVPLENFRESFNGLTLQAEASDDAGILGFTTISTSSLILYYTAPEPKDDGSGDTLINRQLQLFISNGERFNQISNDFSGTELDGLLPLTTRPSHLSNGLTFVQSGTGIVTKLEFPTLNNLREQGEVAINQAELLIYTQDNSTDGYDPSSQLIAYQTDVNNNILLDDNGIARVIRKEDGTFPMLFESREQSYRGVFSLPIQDIFSGSAAGNAILISSLPSSPTFGRLSELGISTSPSVNRVVINNQANDAYRVKLRLFYTVFK